MTITLTEEEWREVHRQYQEQVDRLVRELARAFAQELGSAGVGAVTGIARMERVLGEQKLTLRAPTWPLGEVNAEGHPEGWTPNSEGKPAKAGTPCPWEEPPI